MDFAISAVVKLLQPDASTQYNVQIMVLNSLDGVDTYRAVRNVLVPAQENSDWLRIETYFTRRVGDNVAYIEVKYRI